MAQLLDGKHLADLRATKLKQKVTHLKSEGIQPLFCVINIGNDPSSKIYLKTKKDEQKRSASNKNCFNYHLL